MARAGCPLPWARCPVPTAPVPVTVPWARCPVPTAGGRAPGTGARGLVIFPPSPHILFSFFRVFVSL